MFKHVALIAAVASLGFTSLPAAAQTAGAGAIAGSSASSQSASGSAAQSNNNIVFPAVPSSTQTTVRQEGSSTTRVEAAPSLGGLAVGGGHPCAWTPGSGQISIIGGGLGAAKMTIDEACMLAVMAAAKGDARLHNAALYIIASRDKTACLALRQQGLIGANSCGEPEQLPAGTTISTRNNATPGVTQVGYSKCYMKGDNTVGIKYKSGANKDVAKAACLASLGY